MDTKSPLGEVCFDTHMPKGFCVLRFLSVNQSHSFGPHFGVFGTAHPACSPALSEQGELLALTSFLNLAQSGGAS